MKSKMNLITGVSVISAVIFCGCGHDTAQNGSNTPTAQSTPAPAPTEWNNNATRLSPFTKVQYDGDKVMVTYNDAEYELTAINSLPVSDILSFCKSNYRDAWQRRFAEDLVPVLNDMGHPINADNTVRLSLVDPASGKNDEIASAVMTLQNRQAVHAAFEASRPADKNTGELKIAFLVAGGGSATGERPPKLAPRRWWQRHWRPNPQAGRLRYVRTACATCARLLVTGQSDRTPLRISRAS